MAAGGYRKPENVATYSGPGALSQRTDGNPMLQQTGGGEYGETQAIQGLASETGSAPSAAASAGFTPSVAPPTSLGEPTAWPDVPVTDGAAAGEGRGLSAVTSPYSLAQQDAVFFKDKIPLMIEMADREDTAPSVRTAVRNLLASYPMN